MFKPRFKDNDGLFADQAEGLIQFFRDNKTRLGLTDAQIDALEAIVSPFRPALNAYNASVLTTHSRSLVRDTAKENALKALGTFVDNLGDKFTNPDRVANEMPELTGPGGPRPVPSEVPLLVITNGAPSEFKVQIFDAAHPARLGKPEDVDDAELRWEEDDGNVPADYDDWHPCITPTNFRSPSKLRLKPALRGKTILVVARFRNTNGDGPWSQPVSAILA